MILPFCIVLMVHRLDGLSPAIIVACHRGIGHNDSLDSVSDDCQDFDLTETRATNSGYCKHLEPFREEKKHGTPVNQ